jgi:DNA-binding XRE family transcriptional regulator
MPRPNSKTKRSPADRKRLAALRERFQRERPSLESLVTSGEYTDPISQPDLLMMLELAAALKQFRKDRRLSLSDVAKRSGIDKAALSRIENGQNVNPTVGTLETIARSLGTQLRFQLDVPTRGKG